MRLSQAGFALGAGVFNIYEIVPGGVSVNEGESLSVEVRTAGLANGTTLYWTINHVTSTAADFSETSGSFTITSGVGTFAIDLSADATTEGPEAFSISIHRGSTSGLVVATSDVLAINDTSMTPGAVVTPSATVINEGDTVTFTVDTVNVANGTTLYWSTADSNMIAGDFADNALTGSFTINNNTGSFTRTAKADALTEGRSEVFTMNVRLNSSLGTVIGVSSSVTVSDTSLSAPGQVVFTATGANTGSGDITTHYWTVPEGVFKISVVCVGGGGGGRAFNTYSAYAGGGGGGGALAYRNNIAVNPGQVLRVDVGRGGGGLLTADSSSSSNAYPGGSSWVYGYSGGSIPTTVAEGGRGGSRSGSAAGGSAANSQGEAKFSGGAGGATATSGYRSPSGGGGAAGYAGVGGTGGSGTTSPATNGTSGSGGGGGGGGAVDAYSTLGSAGTGGGVGLVGQGTNGAGGISGTTSTVTSGGPGSSGVGIVYGGGGQGRVGSGTATGGGGGVRIMWPGDARTFPSTRTANE